MLPVRSEAHGAGPLAGNPDRIDSGRLLGIGTTPDKIHLITQPPRFLKIQRGSGRLHSLAKVLEGLTHG